MASKKQSLGVHFYVKGDSMARRKAWPIVLSILSLAIPALLIFSFNLVDAANHNRQHRNTHGTPDVMLQFFQNLLFLYCQVEF